MKTYLRFLLSAISALFLHLSYAQVTLVSNNTYLNGFVLPNGIPILVSDTSDHLYTTNGSVVSVITNNVTYDTGSLVVYKNQLYFTGTDASNDAELWATDGTAGGTRLIKNISSAGSSVPDNFFVFNNLLYFTADDGINGLQLWSSDGSPNNAVPVNDIYGAAARNLDSSGNFFQNGSNIFFTANINNVQGLYKLTSSGVSLIINNIPGSIILDGAVNANGNRTIFTVDTTKYIDNMDGSTTDSTALQIWSTDGTTAGTQLLHTFITNSVFNAYITTVLFNNQLYFKFADTTTSQLWRTDGTPSNTVLFKSFDVDKSNIGLSYDTYTSAVFNNKLYFVGYSNDAGYELWTTDGTSANTTILKDINVGKGSSLPAFLYDYGSLINNYIHSGSVNFNFNQTEQYVVPFKGKLYFTANDSTHGTELWSTDGTSANTNLVKDINTDTTASGVAYASLFENYYTTNGIYFVANDGTTGNEPWVTDGTADGTHLVADIHLGKDSSHPQYSFIYNDQLYFRADNGDNNYNDLYDSLGSPDLYKIDQSTSALPVSLLNFTASKQTASVLLNWTTANEINTHHFTVERSIDGIYFSAIGTLTARGNSISKQGYQLNDATAMQTGSNLLYYRLQSVNKDGTYSYSKVLIVQLQNGVFTFTLSPNPVRNQLTVSFSTGNAKGAVLRIADASGKQLYQQAYSASAQSFIQQTISVAKLVNGTYFIQLITDKETKTLKFIKQ